MSKCAFTLKPVLAAIVLGACSTTPTMPEKAWKIDPVQTVRHGGATAEGYFALGRVKEAQHANAQAIDAYRKALAADPTHVAAWNALGALQMQLGRTDEGLQALERAVSLAPTTSHLHNNLGYALLLAGRDEAAANSLRHAVELDGSNRRAWSNLATAYRRQGALDQADFAEARARGSWPMAAATLANTAPASTSARPAPTVSTAHELPPTTAAPTLVKVAENVFELRNGPSLRETAVAEAATIIAAAVTPNPLPTASIQADSMVKASPASAPGMSTPSPAARYEIANGHGGEGLARRLAGLLGQQGFARPRLTNLAQFNQVTSVIQYRDGYRASAEAFAALLPFQPELLSAAAGSLRVDVRLVLGRDLTTSDACAALGLCTRVARTPTPKVAAAPGAPE